MSFWVAKRAFTGVIKEHVLKEIMTKDLGIIH
jgi:hypothetical protein